MGGIETLYHAALARRKWFAPARAGTADDSELEKVLGYNALDYPLHPLDGHFQALPRASSRKLAEVSGLRAVLRVAVGRQREVDLHHRGHCLPLATRFVQGCARVRVLTRVFLHSFRNIGTLCPRGCEIAGFAFPCLASSTFEKAK